MTDTVVCGAICGKGRLACPDHMEEFVEWVQLWMGPSTLFDILGDGDFGAILAVSEWFNDDTKDEATTAMRYATVWWLLELVWGVRSLHALLIHERTMNPSIRRSLNKIDIRGVVNYLGVNETIGGILQDIRREAPREELVHWRVDTIPLYTKFPDVDMYRGVIYRRGCYYIHSALEWASIGGHSDLVSLLLLRTVDENNYIQDYESRAIQLAANNGHTDVVRILLGDDRVDPASRGNLAAGGFPTSSYDRDNEAIQSAARNGHTGVVALLMADDRVDPASDDHYAFRIAAKNGHTDVVALLFLDQPPPFRTYMRALIRASENGHTGVVALLLKYQVAHPHPLSEAANESNSTTALRFASGNGHADAVALLLMDSQVDPTADNNSFIRFAAERGHVEVVKLFMADYRVDPTSEDHYAFRIAAENGHIDVVALFIKQVPPVEFTYRTYTRALSRASENGHEGVVALMLMHQVVLIEVLN